MAAVERRTELVQLTQAQLERAVALVLPNVRVTAHRLAAGGRANTNYIVETDRGTHVVRIYVRDAATCAKERALCELVSSRVPVAKILGSGGTECGLGHPFSVLEFVPGPTLEELARRGEPAPLLNAAASLGRVLGELTRFPFEQFADLQADANGTLVTVPWSFGDFYRWCLFESPAGARLGPLRDRLWALLERQSSAFSDPFAIHLTHGDFSPTNVLFDDDGRIAAVLDWEFAQAGKLWQDLGNLLRERPECELPSDFERALSDGFAESGRSLPSDWRAHAEFDDLSSACDFLSSVEDKPETHARALRQISRSLAHFDA